VAAGIALGILVGVVSGAAFGIYLDASTGTDATKAADPMKVATSLLAMPTSWFGGGWLTNIFDLDEILSWYVTSLAVSFLIVGAYPLFKKVVQIGNRIGTAK
jgi:hypothetical protein